MCAGTLTCINGSYQCEGTPIVQESCNCLDDDCDGKIDENNGNCPTGSTCNNTGITCECAFPCGGSEFPCPEGKICDTQSGLCITDVCFGVHVRPVDGSGNVQTCSPATGKCVPSCSRVTCGAGDTVCVPHDRHVRAEQLHDVPADVHRGSELRRRHVCRATRAPA